MARVTLNKGDRVRVVRVREHSNPHIGKLGRVDQFYPGFLFSVHVVLDNEDGLFAFHPDELVVVPSTGD